MDAANRLSGLIQNNPFLAMVFFLVLSLYMGQSLVPRVSRTPSKPLGFLLAVVLTVLTIYNGRTFLSAAILTKAAMGAGLLMMFFGIFMLVVPEPLHYYDSSMWARASLRDQNQQLAGINIDNNRRGLNVSSNKDVKRITCKICRTPFPTEDALRYHSKDHESKKFVPAVRPSDPYKCSKCGEEFLTKLWFDLHGNECSMNTQGKKITINKAKDSLKTGPAPITAYKPPNSDPYKCSKCGEEFLTKLWFDLHEEECPMTASSTAKPQSSVPVSKFGCTKCPKQFLSEKSRNDHERSHKVLPAHTQTKDEFRTTNDLRCSYCGVVFERRDWLKSHMERHQNVPLKQITKAPKASPGTMHRCVACPQRFREVKVLQNHEITHINYKPLVGDAVRLLKLSGIDDDELRYELVHEKLGERPSYVALSYEWGNEELRKPIFVNGQPISVTANLEQALLQMRKIGIRVLWVDALCIKQNDNTEKATQVARMFAIYQGATEVAIWIGPHSDGSEVVMQMLADPNMHTQAAWAFKQSSGFSLLVADHSSPYFDPTFLLAFLCRSYWRRLWIIQEVAVGRRARIYCGTSKVEWDNFAAFIFEMARIDAALGFRFFLIQSMIQFRKNWQNRFGGTIPLLRALVETQNARTGKQIDKVYALLGLTSNWKHFLFEADYTEGHTCRKLCLEMTKEVILGPARLLDIIFLGEKKDRLLLLSPPTEYEEEERFLNLPSWCPNYLRISVKPVDEVLARYISEMDGVARLGSAGQRWAATGSHPVHIDLVNITNEKLSVPGLFLGKICAYGSLIGESIACQIPDTQDNPHSKSDSEIFDAISRVLLFHNKKYVELTRYPHLLSELFGSEFRSYLEQNQQEADVQAVYAWLEGHKNFRIRGKSLYSRATKLSSRLHARSNQWTSAISGRAETVSGSVGSSLFGTYSRIQNPAGNQRFGSLVSSIAALLRDGMRFMMTDEGEFGWAHPDVKIGNEVWLLAGCSMPAILQRESHADGDNDSVLSVVGHAYIDEVMNGKLWDTVDPQSLSTVVLR